MNNRDIKALLHRENIYMWQIAKRLGIHETTFCKWFREELSHEQATKVLSAIDDIKLDRLKEQT